MDITNLDELDSFTAEMVRRVQENKRILDELSDSDDESAPSSHVANENVIVENSHVSKENIIDPPKESFNEEDKLSQDDYIGDDDDELLNNDYKAPAHVRESISILLDVRQSVLPSSDDELESGNDIKPSRLKKRLGRITQLYTNEDDDAPRSNVMTENKFNTNTSANTETTHSRPKDLKSRLNSIALSYYPQQDENVPLQTKPSKATFELMSSKSTTSVPAKSSEPIQQKKIHEIVNKIEIKTTIPPPPPMSKIPVSNVNNIKNIPKSDSAPAKKTSVANLKKIFENKPSEINPPNEFAPELLSLKDKRRLFEKAIIDDTKAALNVYRSRGAPPIKRFGFEKYESTKEEPSKEKPECNINLAKDISQSPPKNDQMATISPTLDRYNSEAMSICSDVKSEIVHIDNEELPVIYDNGGDTESQQDSLDAENIGQSSSQESLQKAFETIDNYSVSDHENSPVEMAEDGDDLTFSALENDDQILRTSTRVDLSQGSQSSESLEMKQEKPEPSSPPQIRTISFYRREQKLLKECSSPMKSESEPQILMQKRQAARAEQLRNFTNSCNERIAELKAEVSEHNRISGQASTALTMCLTHADLAHSSGRIEAERLLLIAAERRNACNLEISRLRSMLKSPDRYFHQLSNTSSKGIVTISEFYIPFKTEFVESRARGKVTSAYYFICMVYNKAKVFISELLNAQDKIDRDSLEFKFCLNCQDLNEDFDVKIQIFSLELNKEKPKKDTLSSKSFRMKFGTSSLRRMPKPSMIAESPIPIKNTTQSTSFKPIGHYKINLATVCKPPQFYQLESYPVGRTPIECYLMMKLALSVKHNLKYEGFFDLQDPDTSFWNLRWFMIEGSTLKYWKFPNEAAHGQPPLGEINLKNCINPGVEILKADQRQICMRPFTFTLVTIEPPAVSNAYKLIKGGKITKPVPEIFFMSSQTKEHSEECCDNINKLIGNIRRWETDAVRPYSLDEFNRLLLNYHTKI